MDEKIFDAFIYGFTIDEIANNIDNLDRLYEIDRKEKSKMLYICSNCKDIQVRTDSMIVCKSCGEVRRYEYTSEWIDNIWMKEKSRHSFHRWIKKRLERYVREDDISIIAHDFVRVVGVMRKMGLIKGKNISCYDFYIIRLASRRDIQTINPIHDMKNGKTRRDFEDRLFGVVYKELKWDIGCTCSYYNRWIRSKLT